jgi:hypothetical protein
VREKEVDASDSLLRILSVHHVESLAILFRNSEDAQRFERTSAIGLQCVPEGSDNGGG